MGVATVAVYSDAEVNALHVALADEAFRLGPAPAINSYLRGDAILEVARTSGAQALHPGYGFLSENAGFARSCEAAGVTFIGPPADAIDAMGSKSVAKAIMMEAGVPVVPGYHGEEQSDAFLRGEAERIGYPVMAKAVMGGGGKGMRLIKSGGEFMGALEACRREAAAAFADDRMLLERFVQDPRHVEVQVFADMHGNVVHLFERDCSVQRRHQKVLEEAPAPGLTPVERRALGQAAVRAAQAVGYVGAGTVEFLIDGHTREFFFCEMNTRLQASRQSGVEHPVTEMVTGQDLVKWQIKVAAGEALPIKDQDDLDMRGHAVEARIYAENTHRQCQQCPQGFLPATGHLRRLKLPKSPNDTTTITNTHSFLNTNGNNGHNNGDGQSENGRGDSVTARVRVDTGVTQGDLVTVHYDPMLAKARLSVIAHASTRAEALDTLGKALRDLQVVGVPTNADFCARVASHPEFAKGGVTTSFLEEYGQECMPPKEGRPPLHAVAMGALALLLKQRKTSLGSDDLSPWSPKHGPWRMVGCRQERLSFSSSGPGAELEGEGEGEPVEVAVDCLANGGFVVQWGESRAMVEGEVGEGGELVATVDNRRYAGDVIVYDGKREGEEVVLWCTQGPVEGDEEDRFRYHLKAIRPSARGRGGHRSSSGSINPKVISPMPGRVIRILASVGDKVDKGQDLLIMEAMKMEHPVLAPFKGQIKSFHFAEGSLVDDGACLVTLESAVQGEEAK
ncbi:unnamed protein product [Discosporangium mesarthrocarpum]